MEVHQLLESVTEALRSSPTPLRARGIARWIEKEYGRQCSTSEVNKILYKGPFESVKGDDAAPAWRLRAVEAHVFFLTDVGGLIALKIDSVGVFYLDPNLSDENLIGVLRAISACVPGDQGILLHDTTAGGKRVAGLADICGFARTREVL
jgi:hypothetical protein